MSVEFPMSRSPQEWRDMAADCRRRSAESWERSDNDGFLSQWASDRMASLYDLCADVAEKGGVAEINWVFEGDQPVEKWRWIDGRYGPSVLIPGEGYGNGRFWNPSSAKKGAARLARDQAKGFHWGVVKVEVVVKMVGGYSPYPVVEAKIGAPVEVVQVVSDRYEDEAAAA